MGVPSLQQLYRLVGVQLRQFAAREGLEGVALAGARGAADWRETEAIRTSHVR